MVLTNPPFTSGVVKAMGLVFGDIGTSPIYTFTVLFLFVPPTAPNILGVLSLIIWTLMVLVTVQYAVLAMHLGYKGEGGTIVLKEILSPLLSSTRKTAFVTILAIIGVSLMIGDCVITPAISILSAVEGIRLLPGVGHVDQVVLVTIAALITIGLFYYQKRGSDQVAHTFGPVMLVWFSVLALSGVVSLLQAPGLVAALNPIYAIRFMGAYGIAAFFVLSDVILCATGGEALFADMGHLGKEPIRKAWIFVFLALVLNYLGQGAFLLNNPGAKNVLFQMVLAEASLLYLPFLILTIVATIIASQAVISGIFSIVYQGVTTHILPLLKIEYTSSELRTQIYIGSVNWLLCIAVIIVLLTFGYSERLAGAYGLAVSGTMLITGIMMSVIFALRGQLFRCVAACGVTIVDAVFLSATLTKIPSGALWAILFAAVPFSIIMIYINGQKRLYRSLNPMPLEEFLRRYEAAYSSIRKIRGTALFFARDPAYIPRYITNTIFNNNILYEDNVMVTINIHDRPFGLSWSFKEDLGEGLRVLSVEYGYMQMIDLKVILKEAEVHEKVIFYGMEEIVSDNLIWKIFNAIKRLSPSFVQFYRLPPHKIHGVVTRIEM
ncbi:MAG: KUP/HAK/KT family potassium transporter [Methanomicrobiales archaeon]|nr:KUP/HAK/KT family potassium transporter [Methanomicrobiales archaeon]